MQVQISAASEELLRHKVEAGPYDSASDVIDEALRLLEQRDRYLLTRKDDIKAAISAGMSSLREGRRVDSETVFNDLESELDAVERSSSR